MAEYSLELNFEVLIYKIFEILLSFIDLILNSIVTSEFVVCYHHKRKKMQYYNTLNF